MSRGTSSDTTAFAVYKNSNTELVTMNPHLTELVTHAYGQGNCIIDPRVLNASSRDNLFGSIHAQLGKTGLSNYRMLTMTFNGRTVVVGGMSHPRDSHPQESKVHINNGELVRVSRKFDVGDIVDKLEFKHVLSLHDEREEFNAYKKQFRKYGLAYTNAVIEDFSTPTQKVAKQIIEYGRHRAKMCQNFIVHCGEGWGRTGMALCILYINSDEFKLYVHTALVDNYGEGFANPATCLLGHYASGTGSCSPLVDDMNGFICSLKGGGGEVAAKEGELTLVVRKKPHHPLYDVETFEAEITRGGKVWTATLEEFYFEIEDEDIDPSNDRAMKWTLIKDSAMRALWRQATEGADMDDEWHRCRCTSLLMIVLRQVRHAEESSDTQSRESTEGTSVENEGQLAFLEAAVLDRVKSIRHALGQSRKTRLAKTSVSYTGGYIDGDEKHGYGRKVYRGGSIYEGGWSHNTMNGTGTYTWPDGHFYRGEWRKSLRHGTGIFIENNGNVYKGEYAHDAEHGIGTMIYYNGTVYRGRWMNGKKHGMGTSTHFSGTSYTGDWVDGKKHGMGTQTYSDGTSHTSNWVDGKKQPA